MLDNHWPQPVRHGSMRYPSGMRAAIIVLGLIATGARAQAPTADDLLRAAIAEQQQGDYQSAIRDYRKALQVRPDMMEAKVNLGAALSRTGQYDEAIAMYESALPSLSYKAPVLLNLGLAYYKKGDFPNAHTQFQKVYALQPNNARVAILLGDTDLRLGKHADAVALMQPLDRENANDMDFQFVYGSALVGLGKRREGAERLERVAKSGNRADAYLLAGINRLELDDYALARKDLDEALRLDPKLPNIYTLAGTARDKMGDQASAEPAFREALRLDPESFEANLYLGAMLYKRREIDAAKVYLDHALKLRPNDQLARYESALLKSTAGDYETATRVLEQLSKEDPNWLEPHVQLAALYYKLHRPEDGAREREIVDRITTEQQKKGPLSSPPTPSQ
jgi:tetratricopeptide (TPR) repeat protein